MHFAEEIVEMAEIRLVYNFNFNLESLDSPFVSTQIQHIYF